MDCSPSGSSVHGILQARVLEWVAVSSSRGSSQTRDQTHTFYVFCLGRQVLYHQRHLGSLDLVTYMTISIYSFNRPLMILTSSPGTTRCEGHISEHYPSCSLSSDGDVSEKYMNKENKRINLEWLKLGRRIWEDLFEMFSWTLQNGNLLQYSCLENPMDKGAWWATVHRIAKSQTRLKRLRSKEKECAIEWGWKSISNRGNILCLQRHRGRRELGLLRNQRTTDTGEQWERREHSQVQERIGLLPEHERAWGPAFRDWRSISALKRRSQHCPFNFCLHVTGRIMFKFHLMTVRVLPGLDTTCPLSTSLWSHPHSRATCTLYTRLLFTRLLSSLEKLLLCVTTTISSSETHLKFYRSSRYIDLCYFTGIFILWSYGTLYISPTILCTLENVKFRMSCVVVVMVSETELAFSTCLLRERGKEEGRK